MLKKMLIFEDNQPLSDFLIDYYSAKLEVYAVKTLEEAINFSSRTQFDIFLTNDNSNSVDGLKVLRNLFLLNKDCKILIMTTDLYFNQRKVYDEFYFLQKPFTMAQIDKIIWSFI